jgi:two-component system, OmpR family, sensor histidine kinase BaeS
MNEQQIGRGQQIKSTLQPVQQRVNKTWNVFGQRIHPVWESIQQGMQWVTRPRSLNFQMGAMAGITAIVAIAIVVIISTISVSHSFMNYLYGQVSSSARLESDQVSEFYELTNKNLLKSLENTFGRQHQTDDDPQQLLALDTQGNLYSSLREPPGSPNNPNDIATFRSILQQVIQSGKTTQGDLPENNAGWFNFTARAYAAVPIYDTSSQSRPIIGAVVVVSEQTITAGSGSAFLQGVDRAFILGGIGSAILVTIIGAFLARRITRPLKVVTETTARMAHGDLSARVIVDEEATPTEIVQLATAFNDMARTIEHDVNELRRQERMQRDLVANVAHELATPLTAIHGFAEAMIDDIASDQAEREEFARIIYRETERLQSLVDRIRQVARLEAGVERLEFTAVPLHVFIDDTTSVLRGELERQGLALNIDVPADLPLAWIDTNRLTQVIFNLVDNAARHTDRGGSVEIEAREKDNMLYVAIRDNGTGIPEGDLERIFDRFYRADTSRNRLTGGSGLGLAIVKGIVMAHGGQIAATNNPTGGACVTFSVPLAPAMIPSKVGSIS